MKKLDGRGALLPKYTLIGLLAWIAVPNQAWSDSWVGASGQITTDQTNTKVGIGKTPTVALDVNGAAAISSGLGVTGVLNAQSRLNIGGATDNSVFALNVAGGAMATQGSRSIISYGFGIPGDPNFERASLIHTGSASELRSEWGGTGTARPLRLVVGGTTRYDISGAGAHTVTGPVSMGSTLGVADVVKIGTGNPTYASKRLTVIGNGFDNAALQLENTDVALDANGRNFNLGVTDISSTEGRLDLTQPGTRTVLSVFKNGNVGIGSTTDNGRKLQISGGASVSSNFAIGGTTTFGNYAEFSNGVSSLPSSDAAPLIYATSDASSGSNPFSLNGHLVLQARSGGTSGRDVIFYSGTTPTIRYRLNPTGQHLFTSPVTVSAPFGVEGNAKFGTGNVTYPGKSVSIVGTSFDGSALQFENTDVNTVLNGRAFNFGITDVSSSNGRLDLTQPGERTVLSVFNSGNLGLGSTTDGGERLQVTGAARITGAVAISATLDVSQSMSVSQGIQLGSGMAALADTDGKPRIYGTSDAAAGPYPFSLNGNLILQARSGGTTGRDILFYTGTSPAERYRINAAGSHAFTGDVNMSSNLDVAGELKVGTVVATNWRIEQAPDYVFEKGYDLAPLEEVESFVNKNKHLPEVPSAREMKQQGLDLVKMNFDLLKKVEELTLHAIRQEKEMKKQAEAMKQQAEEIRVLKERL